VLIGLVGRGIQMSRSPAMHEAEGRRLGLTYIYTLLDTERMGTPPPPLSDVLRYAEYLGYCGVNITRPYKQESIDLVDELSDNADAVGSINTVVFRAGRRIGHNTDLWGFLESFRRTMPDAPRGTVLLLGAGGAGVAVGQALLECGVGRLLIHDTQTVRGEALRASLAARFDPSQVATTDDLPAAAAAADGVVNATPVGMAKMPGMPIPAGLLRPALWVADIVYFPLETELLRTARSIGCRTMDGEGMAVHQAARAFELFTGIAPDSESMRATFAAFAGVSAT
jgi:shikimate dehydrogenase